MGKTAFLFPGQGAQCVGMAREFYDTYQVSRDVFAEASRVCGFSLEELCFREDGRLGRTRYTQPALLTAECAILAAVEAEGLRADLTAGLSLGEYGALVASRALTAREAVRIVCGRGAFMEEAAPPGKGGMAAVISRGPLPVEEICRKAGGAVWVANYNCPGQQVITGEKEAVEAASRLLLEAGAVRVVPLSVSGPFHCRMLSEAAKKLQALLAGAQLGRPEIPFFSNVTGREAEEPGEIRRLLCAQVCSQVLWQQSVEHMIEKGADVFIEIGPGRTLGNFVRKTDRSVRVFQISTPEDLRKRKEELGLC